MNIRDLFDLSGRVAIVTGGGTHLGRAMATALGELGATVVIASRRRELCEQVAAEMRADGLDCHAAGCDVAVEVEVNALVDSVAADRGGIDIMVCNAGGSATTSYIPQASIDEFRRTYEVNTTSTYMCAQAAARHMIPAGYGRIVTVWIDTRFADVRSSVLRRFGFPQIRPSVPGGQRRDNQSHSRIGLGAWSARNHRQLHQPRSDSKAGRQIRDGRESPADERAPCCGHSRKSEGRDRLACI